MKNQEIKDVIRDFISFDIENNYYQKEDKEELVRNFKKIVYEDDTTVRQFLKAFFESTKKLANEYSLVAGEGEVEEEPVENEEPEEDVGEEQPEEEVQDEIPEVPESTNIYRSTAARILYE
jgi:hypothetical protein